MRTLHSYFFRELLKTFAMTALALTLLVVMGGGVANIFKAQGVGAREMAKVFLLLTPVAITLILPVAALFSVAITYGRAAADNEITACRAAGINIQRILLSAALLGLFVTGTTYYAWNYFIPSLSEQLTQLGRRDLPKIIVGELERSKAVKFGKYRLTAEAFQLVPPEQLPPEVRDMHTIVWLRGASFLETEGDSPTRFGTADETYIDFDRSQRDPTVTARLVGVRSFDAAHNQYIQLAEQQLGPYEIPMPLKPKLKFANVDALREYADNPDEIPEVNDLLFQMRRGLMDLFAYQEFDAAFDMQKGGKYTLYGPDGHETLILYQQIRRSADERETELAGVQVLTHSGGETLAFAAKDAKVVLKNNPTDRANPHLIVELSEVERRTGGRSDGRTVKSAKETAASVNYLDQPALKQRSDSFDYSALLDPEESMNWMPPKLSRLREKLLTRKSELTSEVGGEIHFRAAYACSAIATVLLGAMLGIVLRGGQVLTAFGISCVPTAVVVVAGIVGRNMSSQPQYGYASVAVMWGATALMFAACAAVSARWLPK